MLATVAGTPTGYAGDDRSLPSIREAQVRGDDSVVVALSVEGTPIDPWCPAPPRCSPGAQLHDAGPGARTALPPHGWAAVG